MPRFHVWSPDDGEYEEEVALFEDAIEAPTAEDAVRAWAIELEGFVDGREMTVCLAEAGSEPISLCDIETCRTFLVTPRVRFDLTERGASKETT